MSCGTQQIYCSGRAPAYKLVIGGAGDGAIRSYKSNTGDLVWVCNSHTERVSCLVVSERWEYVVSASSDGTMSACNIKSGIQQWTVTVFPGREAIVTMASSDDLWMVFVAGETGSIVAYDSEKGKELWRTPPQAFDVVAMSFILPVGVPSFLARFVYSYLLSEDSQGVLTARDTKVCTELIGTFATCRCVQQGCHGVQLAIPVLCVTGLCVMSRDSPPCIDGESVMDV